MAIIQVIANAKSWGYAALNEPRAEMSVCIVPGLVAQSDREKHRTVLGLTTVNSEVVGGTADNIDPEQQRSSYR